MLTVRHFVSFEESKDMWEALEKESFHYPFQCFWYQNVFAKHFSKKENTQILGVFDNDQLIAIGGFEIIDNTILFLGTRDVAVIPGLSQDLTDFGDMLIHPKYKEQTPQVWEILLTYFKNENLNTLDLRYVRQDSPTLSYFQEKSEITQQETSPFISLPQSWDDYLTTLSKKDRHELKRKIKRLESQAALTLCTDQTIQDKFNDFIALHRASDKNKEAFMTEAMKDFFWDLIICDKHDWQTHICDMRIENKTVASVMIFTSATHMLLFNSGYEPELGHLSVGFLLKAFLVKEAIEEKKKIYDFLRGNERYKYDLGAKDLPLYRIRLNM